MYVEKSKKLEDAKSSATPLIIVGVLGLLFVALVWLDIIHINMAMYMKIMYTIIFVALFVVFILCGVYYKKRSEILATEVQSEEDFTKKVITEFSSEYPLEVLDSMLSSEDTEEEQLYYARYEQIAQILRSNYQIEDENYLDYLIEKIFQYYFPEE